MPFRSGLGAQLGVIKDASYGVYQAPTRFFPFTSEGLTLTREYVRSQGLRAGQLVQAQNLHVGTTRTVEGPVVQEIYDRGMGFWFDLLHGNVVTPTLVGGGTLAFQQLHEIGENPSEKSAMVQVGRPDTAGVVQPFSYLGCVVTQMSVSLEASGLATVTFTLDGQDEVTDEALAVATYDLDALPFNFTQGDVLVAAAGIGNVRSVTLEVNLPQATDRYHLGNTGVKDQPIPNAYAEITANATLEFASLADHARFKNEDVVALDLPLIGAEIEAGNNAACTFKAPAAKQVSSGPTVEGPDVITTEVSFECLANGTDPALTIDYVSVDTTL